MQYFINRDGRQFGPYSLEDLHRYLVQGSVLVTDLAWAEGMPAWVPVSQVLGIPAPSAAPPPPPRPPAMAAPAAPYGFQPQAPAYLAPPPRKSKAGLIVAVVAILILAGAAYLWRSGAFIRTVEERLAVDKVEMLEFYDLATGKPSPPKTRLFLTPWPNTNIIGKPTFNPSDNLVLFVWLTYTGGSTYELRGSPETGSSPTSRLLATFTVTLPEGYSHPLDLTRLWEVRPVPIPSTQLQFVGYADGAGPAGSLLSRLLPDRSGKPAIADAKSFLQRGYEDLIGSTYQQSLDLAGKPTRIMQAANPADSSQTAAFEFHDGLSILRVRKGAEEKVFEVTISSDRWKLWKELGVGATTNAILQTLGPPAAQSPEFLHYTALELGGSLQYRMKNGICTGLLWRRHF